MTRLEYLMAAYALTKEQAARIIELANQFCDAGIYVSDEMVMRVIQNDMHKCQKRMPGENV